MTHPPKERIRQSFERAAASYDQAAAVQRRVCDDLLAALPPLPAPGIILDAGSGTGYARPLLARRFADAHLVALDLSPAMLARHPAGSARVVADVERLPIASGSVDLYWSSLTWQWCDLPRVLAETRRVLGGSGRLAVATLGASTFSELRAAFASVDQYRHTLGFAEPEAIGDALRDAGYTGIAIDRQPVVAHFPDLRTLLASVKAIGANQVGAGRRPGLMSRSAWQRVEAAYAERRDAAGLPLTYDVIRLYAQS